MGIRDDVVRALAAAGCVAPDEEAAALLVVGDGRPIEALVERRVRGEPLPWVVGSVAFAGLVLRIDAGVYVPRPFTEALARRAAALLPADGVAVDLCTGCGAVAAVLREARRGARVVATDVDPVAVGCARANGVDALLGDLDAPLPAGLRGRVDVLTAVVPYVPSEELHLLPRDVTAFEPAAALDGGPGGTTILERVVDAAPRWLRAGGHALLELGGAQAEALVPRMRSSGLRHVETLRDDDGRDRGIVARHG